MEQIMEAVNQVASENEELLQLRDLSSLLLGTIGLRQAEHD